MGHEQHPPELRPAGVEGTEPGLAQPRGADDHDGVVRADPVRLGQGEHLGSFEASGAGEVDALDGGGHPERGGFKHAVQPAVVALGELPVDKHGQAFLEPQRVVVGMLALFEQAPGHAGQPERVQPIEGGVGQQRCSFQR